MVSIEDELNIEKDAELVWGLKYYGRALCRDDDSELGMGRLMLRAAKRIKELRVGAKQHGRINKNY